MRKLYLLPLCAAAYVLWPCVELYRLGVAVESGNVQALTTGVDWDSVREGLKEDIADGIMGEDPGVTTADTGALPPFGAGFVKGMAGNVVDRMVTPEHLAAEFRTTIGLTRLKPDPMSLRGWFDNPTRVEASFRPDKTAVAASAPILVQMDLLRQGWGFAWCVTRVTVPGELLARLDGGSDPAPASGGKVFAGP